MGFGEVPPEYNVKIHGPYDPARYYGKPDTPFGEVKLGDLTKWLGRRNKSPQAMCSAIGRAWWRWQHKYMFPKKAGIAPLIQLIVATCGFFYVINYPRLTKHRFSRYH